MPAKKNQLTVILLIIIALMGTEIIYLVYQNRKLQSMVGDPTSYFKTLKPDQSVPSIRARDIEGKDISFRYSPAEPYTLLLWFSAACEACRTNFEFWNELYDGRIDSRIRFAGFCSGTPDESRQIASEQNIRFPVLSISDPSMVEAFGGNILPQTILISPEGKVLNSWPGALEKKGKDEIISELQARGTIIR